jgi:hypothetical protein
MTLMDITLLDTGMKTQLHLLGEFGHVKAYHLRNDLRGNSNN